MRLAEKVVVPELSPNTEARLERRFVEAVRQGEARSSVVSFSFARGFKTLAVGVAVAGLFVAGGINLRAQLESRSMLGASLHTTTTEVHTGSDGVTLSLGGATISVAPNSQVILARTIDGEVSAALRRGKVDCEVEPRPGRKPFWVNADSVAVRVVGTVFSVAHDPQATADDRVRVAVERGKVAVSRKSGDEVMVAAGSQWSANDGITTAITALENGASPNAIDAIRKAGQPTTEPVPVTPNMTEAANAAKPKLTATPRVTGPVKKAPVRNKPSNTNAPRRMSAPNGSPALLAAMALDNSDPQAAIRAYSKIATEERGAVASFALYSRAYVQYLKLGDRRGALQTLNLFRRRFRKSRESESALWLQITALCASGKSERCRAAAHSYARRYPAGQFSAAAQEIIDSL